MARNFFPSRSFFSRCKTSLKRPALRLSTSTTADLARLALAGRSAQASGKAMRAEMRIRGSQSSQFKVDLADPVVPFRMTRLSRCMSRPRTTSHERIPYRQAYPVYHELAQRSWPEGKLTKDKSRMTRRYGRVQGKVMRDLHRCRGKVEEDIQVDHSDAVVYRVKLFISLRPNSSHTKLTYAT